MSDKLFTQDELEAEDIKETVIKNGLRSEYKKQLDVTDDLIHHINQYAKHYGRHSNVFDDLISLKEKLQANKKALNEFLDVIC